MDLKTADSRLEINRGIKEGKVGIDRKFEDEKYRGVIRGVAIMTKGNVKDYRAWEIDETTLDQIIESGKKHSNLGLKSRFGHPNMSNRALGTFLGRANNFYRDGDIVRADLFISKTAYDTPEGDLASYVLDLAEKDPDAFGTSVVLGVFELEYRIEKNGTPKKDEKGKELPPLLRVNSLLAVDVVDEPAANDGMFNKLFNSSVELSAKATGFLGKLIDNPDALDYVISFLERFRINRVDIDGTMENKNTKQKEVTAMEALKEITLEQLKQARPDLVTALQQEGISSERIRSLSIIKHAQTEFAGMGMEAIMLESVETGKTFDASVSAMRGKRIADLEIKKNPIPGANGEGAGKVKTHLEKAQEYAELHKCGITEALTKTAEPRKQ